jgi:formate dehydrogenase gamma subunit
LLQRFVLAERLAHWLYALFFLVAFVSGVLMWLPATREWMGGTRFTVSRYHAAIGLAMVLVPLLVMVVLDRRRLRADLREVDLWDGDDRRWFGLALRGYTLRGRAMPAQGRLNAGQKANVVLVAAMAVGFAVTGGILMHKDGLPAWLVSRALWLHGFLAIASVALFLGHLAHVFLTKHGRVYLGAMVRGTLPEGLARERHRRWWEEMTAARRQEAGPPAGAAATGLPLPSGQTESAPHPDRDAQV